jgi:hypothetical protein
MRQPRPEAFDPTYKKRQPEPIDLAGITPVKPKSPPPSSSAATSSQNRTVEPNAPTERLERTPERSNRTVLDELEAGVAEDRRRTERYSFEIYADQKQLIEELQYQYKKRTGKNLSKSRIIRESLNEYLKKLLNQAA